jgi:pimeloyl-ACP methyl ester carboxylesterase
VLVPTSLGRVFVHSTGEGPDVVLWHSLLCDTSMWREQLKALAPRFRLHSIDAPGHGRSEPVRRAFTLDDCVDVALDVLDALSLERTIWVGLSWGGMVGMRLAARHRERVTSLVLLDTSARKEPLAKRVAYGPLLGLTRVVGPARGVARVLHPLFFASRTLRERPELAEAFSETLTGMDVESVVHAVRAVSLERTDCTDELSAIAVPTLVIVGDEDRATVPAESEHIARSISGAELVRVPDAGHLSPLERPDVVTPAIERFLGALSSRDRA